MSGCPACATELRPLPELYDQEVRKVDADLERLSLLAPPTNRTAIHGFILGVLVWISFLTPFFVVNHFWRANGTIWALTLLWVPVFLKARAKDRRLRTVYEARRGCPACGWVQAP